MLLFAGICIFTCVMFTSEHYFHDDGQLFQVTSNLVAGFSGAFFTRLKPQTKEEEARAIGGAVASTETLTVKNPEHPAATA